MGLKHTYVRYALLNPPLSIDDQAEFCLGHQDALPDVFGVPVNNWCEVGNGGPGVSATCPTCYFNEFGGVDPFVALYDGYTNNVMGNNDINGFLSPHQMGRMHRTLMSATISQFATGYSPLPYIVPAVNQTWDWRMKFYQDIIVGAGVTLTIKCEIQMVPEARIIVQAGGRLIIDGGVVTVAKYATQRWAGIEVRGTGTADQSPLTNNPEQGYLELRNGGRIEHAQIGANLGSTLNNEGGGGIIVVNGTPSVLAGSFINCRKAVTFAPFTYGSASNAAILRFVHFERNNDYLPESDPAPDQTPGFVEVNQAPGVTLRGCTFANNQQGITESHLLAQGIRTYNSRISILPGCPVGNTCPPAQEVPTTFSNLDHAVEARSSGGDHYLTIRKANFINNIAGVYTSGLTGLSITQCDFVLGNNPVALTHPDEDPFWDDYHRGIYTYNSWGLTIRDNHLARDQAAPTDNTEGIVIGYNRDHNDVVHKNEIEGVYRAYVGEGICAETYNGGQSMIGLQFRCNTNTGNDINIWSRKVLSDEPDFQTKHTIRTSQGYQVAADNLFDNWAQADPDRWDYYIDTDWRINYRYRNTNPLQQVYRPASYDPERLYLLGIYRPNHNNPFCVWYFEGQNAPRDAASLGALITQEKLAYGNTRYLYDALLDGGSTDEVVQEIASTWPNEAWQLRTYLLNLSPFLTVDALKGAVNKAYFPMAMKAEVCIANPDATQQEGFVKWLESYADEPMPGYLIDLIKASWDTKTYRTDLEMELADHHTELTQTAHELLDLYHSPGSTATTADQRWVWQQIRTTAARYAEAALLLGTGEYTSAKQVVESIPLEQDLRDPQWQEQQRMLDYMDVLHTAALDGRNNSQLQPTEVSQLAALRIGAHDRASNWINNLLCIYYHDCLAPYTGGGAITPKSIGTTSNGVVEEVKNKFFTAPNPAEAWVTFSYKFTLPPNKAFVQVKDATGRSVANLPMLGTEAQLVMDTRALAKGVYTVNYMANGEVLQLDRLILQ